MKQVIIIAVTFLSLAACKKIEGEGGTSVIKGKIHVKNYNPLGTLISEYDGAKEDVYIIYGDENNVYDDKMEASYDGTFEFKYLEKGTYTIFAYEECATCDSGDSAVIKTVTIDEKKSTVDIGDLVIRK